MEMIIGMGECCVTDQQDDIIKTFALASCVAVTAYCPTKRVAGMVHIVLPSPFNNKDKLERPGYFAETGVPLLLNIMNREFNCDQTELNLQIYGGATSSQCQDIFNISGRNIETIRSVLRRMGLQIQKSDLGGAESRTLTMETKTGLVSVYRQPIL
jgi:chemotaxis protein CheD